MQTSADQEFVELQRALAGEYSLERELGRGGMGIVYLARDVQLDRLVAIKVLPESLAARAELRERFLREARTAAGLSHPNIVAIHRVGEAGAFVFFVMAYVDGETLGQRLRDHGPLAPSTAARVLREVAWALAYAHGRGVVHRDIKPDNILLERQTERALVTDFGIAQVANALEVDDKALTIPGQVMGTAHFMSPEQAASEPVDGRGDLYSLGVVGFLALSGRLPFDAPTVPALLAKQLAEPAPPLAAVAPSVPERLSRAIDRCLRKERDERFASGEALAEAMEATTAAERQLPLPLRVWAQQKNPARGLYVAWSGICGLTAVGKFINLAVSGWTGPHGAGVLVPAGLALLPLIPIAIFHLRQTNRVLRAGYSLADLRYALARWRAERQEELVFEHDEKPSLPLRALRVATYASVPAFAGWIAACILTGAFRSSSPYLQTAGRVTMALFLAIPATIVASTTLGVPLLPRRLSRAMSLRTVRSRFWDSRLGTWTAKLLAGRRPRGAPDQLVDRPTEMALGLAASDLFAALPKPYREQLRELPAVARQLESRATALRERIEEVATLLASAEEGRPDSSTLAAAALDSPRASESHSEQVIERLRATHDQLRHDLGRTVAMLESIRLDLLRVHGGVSDLEPLTTLIDAASDVERELGFLIEAQREVRKGAVAERGGQLLNF